METLILTGAPASGKTILANFIHGLKKKSIIFDDVDKESDIIRIASNKHRIPYSTDYFKLVIICTNLKLDSTFKRYGIIVDLNSTIIL